MTTIRSITNYLEKIAPLESAESFDNVGLLIGNYADKVDGVLVTLDTLEETVDQAVDNGCNLIISYHPIIFNGLKKINGDSYVERVVFKAIKQNIAIYATHTALDNSAVGVSAKMCDVLGIKKRGILLPKTDLTTGTGMIGRLAEPMCENDFLQHTKKIFKAGCLRYSKKIGKPIHKVAVLGGSGSFAISYALKRKADAYITADLKYHDFFKAENSLMLIDVGHYESEQFTKNLLADYLTEKFSSLAIVLSEKSTNPIYYL